MSIHGRPPFELWRSIRAIASVVNLPLVAMTRLFTTGGSQSDTCASSSGIAVAIAWVALERHRLEGRDRVIPRGIIRGCR